MKHLIVYYSRTGTTKKVAELLRHNLDADIEELIDKKSRKGMLGYFISGKDALFRKHTELHPVVKDPSKYDIVVIGTPVWGHNLCPAVRTYIAENLHRFNKVAFFCTMQSSGDESTFKELISAAKRKPVALMSFRSNIVNDSGSSGELVKKALEFSHLLK